MTDEDKKSKAGELFGANLARLRRERGLGIDDLASKGHLSADDVSAYERADKSPPLEDMRRIAAAHDVPLVKVRQR